MVSNNFNVKTIFIVDLCLKLSHIGPVYKPLISMMIYDYSPIKYINV